jgi:phosphoglycolate phosphatase
VSVSAPLLRCFDLDGCVVVSDAAIADGLHHAVAVVGLPRPDADTLRAAIGPPLLTTFAGLLRAAGHDPEVGEGAALLTAAVDAYRTRYAEVGFDLTRPVPGIVALLEQVRTLPGRTVIVTAKPTAVAEPLLAHVGLHELFDAVHGAPLGPDVEEKRVTLARALDTHGATADAAIMIGDRSHDVNAGRACGTRTVGVLWGAGDRDELEAAGADHVVERPEALSPLLTSGR